MSTLFGGKVVARARVALRKLPQIALACVFASVAGAQTRPDGGTLEREYRELPLALPPRPMIWIEREGVENTVAAGTKVKVRGFEISGATLLPVEELQKVLQGRIGKELGFLELEEAAHTLARYYRKRGFLRGPTCLRRT